MAIAFASVSRLRRTRLRLWGNAEGWSRCVNPGWSGEVEFRLEVVATEGCVMMPWRSDEKGNVTSLAGSVRRRGGDPWLRSFDAHTKNRSAQFLSRASAAQRARVKADRLSAARRPFIRLCNHIGWQKPPLPPSGSAIRAILTNKHARRLAALPLRARPTSRRSGRRAEEKASLHVG